MGDDRLHLRVERLGDAALRELLGRQRFGAAVGKGGDRLLLILK